MIEVQIRGFPCQLSGNITVELDKALEKACRWRVAGYEHMTAFKEGRWDGYKRLYNSMSHRFPIGLLQRVMMILMMDGIKYKIIDFRNEFETKIIETNPEYELRDYQKPIVENAIKMGYGLIRLPTGSGKTIMFLQLMAKLGRSAIILVPTRDLRNQTLEKMKDVCYIDGMELDTKWMKDFDREWNEPKWGVATWQGIHTLIRDLKPPDKTKKKETNQEKKDRLELARDLKKAFSLFDVIVIDEAHIAGAEAVHETASWFPAKFRYGTSATPWRTTGDDLRMVGSIGEVTKGISDDELVKDGWLVPMDIDFVEMPRTAISDFKLWSTVYREQVVENDERNMIVADLAMDLVKEGRSTLIMLTQIKHGHLMVKELKDYSTYFDTSDVAFVHGQLPDGKRKRYTEEFKNGDRKVAISSSVWNQGVDIPRISGMILAGPNKSQLINEQRMGRGGRIWCPQCGVNRCNCDNKKKVCKVKDCDDEAPYLRDWRMEREYRYRTHNCYTINRRGVAYA